MFRSTGYTGQVLPRSLTIDVGPLVTFPMDVLGTEFQLLYEVSSFDSEIALGSGEIWVVPRQRR